MTLEPWDRAGAKVLRWMLEETCCGWNRKKEAEHNMRQGKR